MKRFISIVALVLVFAVPAFALSDAEYLRMKKSSTDFAEADKFLSDAYKNVKSGVCQANCIRSLFLRYEEKTIHKFYVEVI